MGCEYKTLGICPPSAEQTIVDNIPTSHDVTPQVNTISCSLDNLIKSLCYVSKPPKISDIREIDNGVTDAVNLEFYREYNKSPDYIPFKSAVELIIPWVSDLKFISSTFINYLIPKLCLDRVSIPEINDAFLTKVMMCLSGRQINEFSPLFSEFSKIYRIKYYFPWLSNSSQIVCHLKNEMATAAKNNIFLNAYRRIKANIRWRLFEYILAEDLDYDIAKLQTIIDTVYNYITISSEIVLDEKQNEYIPSSVCNDIFSTDIEIMKDVLLDNPCSRNNLAKIKKHDKYVVSTKPLDFNITIRKNPQKLIPYLYHIQTKVKELGVTAKYYELCKAATDANTKAEQKEIWKSWKFKFVNFPSFKLMPLNKIKRHFIRIDMKSLYELGICVLGVEKLPNKFQTNLLNPKVKTSVDGTYYTQIKKTKLPEHLNGLSVFYNENRTEQITFKHITKQDLNSADQWWLSDVLDIYSKKAKIRQLQREKVVRCRGDL